MDLRQKALEKGIQSLSDSELVALTVGVDLTTAQYILDYAGGTSGLANLTPETLCQVEGIGMARAVALCAALQLGRRVLAGKLWEQQRVVIQRPADAAQLVLHDLTERMQETLQVILLDSKQGVLDVETVYVGSLNATVVRIAEIFRPAILRNAAGIIVAHNHPAGDPEPSPQDLDLTRLLVDAGKRLDIPVLDHLIIGSGRWLSLRDRGLPF